MKILCARAIRESVIVVLILIIGFVFFVVVSKLIVILCFIVGIVLDEIKFFCGNVFCLLWLLNGRGEGDCVDNTFVDDMACMSFCVWELFFEFFFWSKLGFSVWLIEMSELSEYMVVVWVFGDECANKVVSIACVCALYVVFWVFILFFYSFLR